MQFIQSIVGCLLCCLKGQHNSIAESFRVEIRYWRWRLHFSRVIFCFIASFDRC